MMKGNASFIPRSAREQKISSTAVQSSNNKGVPVKHEEQQNEANSSAPSGEDRFEISVCGLHLRGQPLCHQLKDLGGVFVKACKSSPDYRLFAITDFATGSVKPGMIAVTDGSGRAIDLEVWALPITKVGHFLKKVHAPLGIGTVRLEDGSSVKGFNCEGFVMDGGAGIEDITLHGGWLSYLRTKSSSNRSSADKVNSWLEAAGPTKEEPA